MWIKWLYTSDLKICVQGSVIVYVLSLLMHSHPCGSPLKSVCSSVFIKQLKFTEWVFTGIAFY